MIDYFLYKCLIRQILKATIGEHDDHVDAFYMWIFFF